jgi:hypothetical protein
MNSLREIQRAFKNSVLSQRDTAVGTFLVEGGISAADRIQIYRNNARIGFHAAMVATFPVIEQLGGSDWFKQSAREFQLMHPSVCGDLQYVGAKYPQFLEETLQDTDYRYFADVAALEWAYQEVLIAATSSPLDPQALATFTQPQYPDLQFSPRTEMRLMHSIFPVLDLWKAHQPGTDTLSCHIQFDRPPVHILLIRRNDHVELREIAETDYALLQHLSAGATLGEVVERVAAAGEFDLGSSLQHLFSLQVFAGVKARADEPIAIV